MNLADIANLRRNASQPPTPHGPQLPTYARDGRALNWNATGTAVWFESTDVEYHSDWNAVSSSMLKTLDQSPAHLKALKDSAPNQVDRSRKQAYFFGTAVHSAVLEPHLFRSLYKTYPGPISGNTRGTKAFAKYCADNPGFRPVLPGEIDPIRRAAINVLQTEVIRSESGVFLMKDLVAAGAAERVIYWLDAATGVTCKARLDLLVHNVIVDLKTTTDARKERFRYDASKFGYHIQAAFYMEALSQFLEQGQLPIMLFLVVEKSAPFATKVYQADKETFWLPGQRRVRQLLMQYRECVRTRNWPAYTQSAELLRLPASKLYQDVAEIL